MTRASRRRALQIGIGLAVSAGLLVYFFWKADFHAIGAQLARTHWGFLTLGIALNFASLWSRVERWRLLFPPGAHPSHLFNATMIGYMGNNLLPLRAGEVLRVYVVSRRGQRLWTTVATVVVERVMDGLAIGLMLAGLFLVVPFARELRWAVLVFLGVDLALMAGLAALVVAPDRIRGLAARLLDFRPRLRTRGLEVLDTLSAGLTAVRTARRLPAIGALTVGLWGVLALSTWAMFRAGGLALPFLAAWALIALLGLGVSLPSSPGYAGIFQAATVFALAPFGVPQDQALAFSILFHLAHYVPVTLCGLILMVVEQVSLAEARLGAGLPPRSARRAGRPAGQ
ncbi:MAG: flippase-like domain-containing protein [Candidatus Rokubacteria bacterium]|nr:flippase-like domain-containing protein [Candidatus Rokubacteria bacterium]